MTWVPTLRQLTILAEYSGAGIPVEAAARALGVEAQEIEEIGQRLAKGRAAVIMRPDPDVADTAATPLAMRDRRSFS